MKRLSLTNLTLLVALALSSVAAYYSIIGLVAIFPGAQIPIIVMGIILEIAKLTTTLWLRTYWDRCGVVLKLYLVPAVVTLALITSLGIFGFLSKAHIDQGLDSGNVSSQVALIDEKIKTQKENIKSSREALAQMDLQVNQVITKGDTQVSAERSVQIRRQQAKERATIGKEIDAANAIIGKLNEERAPIASQLRKVEAEVGPIKYVAAMIYGDNAEAGILEKAVRWVIILLVLVFDPLAVAMLLAANQSRLWDLDEPKTKLQLSEVAPTIPDDDITTLPAEMAMVQPEVKASSSDPISVITEGVTKVIDPEYKDLPAGYVSYQGKHMQKDVLKHMRPDLFLKLDDSKASNTNFGIEFPPTAKLGDTFVRVDILPNRVYKFNGDNWILVDKTQTSSYMDQNYIKHLVAKIDSGEYDVELLSENEKQLIEEYLTSQKPA
jgi:hypothetical protein